MHNAVLSSDQIDHFIQNGWVRLEEAIKRADALAVQDYLWEHVEKRGVLKADKSTWTQPMVHIKEAYSDGPFQNCQTERLTNAILDLVGEGRWSEQGKEVTWGWWPVNFSQGADEPWTVPVHGWHWDGIHFRHYIDAPDQGLLLLPMFSDTIPHGGATVIAEGSHKLTARYLNSKPEGVELGAGIQGCIAENLWLQQLVGKAPLPEGENRVSYFMDKYTTDENGTRLKVVEAVANAGDVYMCHPFLFHAAAQNHSKTPRFMCNRTVKLTQRLHIHDDSTDLSPLEISVRAALEAGGQAVAV